MNRKVLLSTLVAASLLSGCATGLNSIQKREYEAFKHDGVLVKEKEPVVGALLGILPGGGSFYAGEAGLGLANLMFWPMSVLWDPVSGYNGSVAINYDITKLKLRKEKEKEINALDEKLALEQLTQKEYILAKREIEQKYSYE
ncbi:hypothetical protein Maes01_02471 [Microbulbifer aestuariivivens]|uniref:TM2 domain-containing protein n=1 Tax=Microbulbifer aestuariivivens TaxID=1908308 RepID=A0ABP9WTH4_9GAMM